MEGEESVTQIWNFWGESNGVLLVGEEGGKEGCWARGRTDVVIDAICFLAGDGRGPIVVVWMTHVRNQTIQVAE